MEHNFITMCCRFMLHVLATNWLPAHSQHTLKNIGTNITDIILSKGSSDNTSTKYYKREAVPSGIDCCKLRYCPSKGCWICFYLLFIDTVCGRGGSKLHNSFWELISAWRWPCSLKFIETASNQHWLYHSIGIRITVYGVQNSTFQNPIAF